MKRHLALGALLACLAGGVAGACLRPELSEASPGSMQVVSDWRPPTYAVAAYEPDPWERY